MDNFVEEQENFDIFFLLKNQDFIKAHSDILSAYSTKFNNFDSPLVFYMDDRIEQSVMWIVLTYIYFGEPFEMDIENLDSYILLAYFFEDPVLMYNADNFLYSTLNTKTAIDKFHYAIDMEMSYNCKNQIYDFIKGNVNKLPEYYTLDMVLMQPDILSVEQNEYKVHMDNIMKGVPVVPPIIAINSEVIEVSVSENGEPTILVHDVHKIIAKKEHGNIVVKPEPLVALEQIEKQIEKLANPQIDALYKKVEEQLHVVGNPEVDNLFEQIEELLLDVDNPGVFELFEQVKQLLAAMEMLKKLISGQL